MKALYFPYIEVPRNPWFIRMLLYWDQVGSIVPMDQVDAEGGLSPYMRDLMGAGLLDQVSPGHYLAGEADMGEPFLHYIAHSLRRRSRARLRPERRVRVHVEKVGRVGEELVNMGLGVRSEYPWYEFDAWVARSYMAYLASVLGKLQDIDAAPVTNDLKSFRILGGVQRLSPYAQRRALTREFVLEETLPCPATTPSVGELVRFKERYGHVVANFRTYVDKNCTEIARIDDIEARDDRIQIFKRGISQELEPVQDAFCSSWQTLTFGGLVPLLGSTLVLQGLPPDATQQQIGGGLLLAGAVYQTVAALRTRKRALQHPLAYAALARDRFA